MIIRNSEHRERSDEAAARGPGEENRLHIPDGYLSPVISVGMAVATVPAWAVATRRVQAVLSNRTIPLLAIFAALCFTIMMFNVPVPGGTTAHGVGGTLAAIVLGPWAAAIAVSVALIIQALFFGDGGVLAIFVNCLNMAFILPFVGWLTYRLLAGRSQTFSTRRVWAAGIGAYVGLTASALAVGIELGIQPALFSENGHALYSPYGLAEAIPAMLIAHLFGASVVEGLITALGLAYLQQRHPEYLGALRNTVANRSDGTADPTGPTVPVEPIDAPADRPRRPFWQVAGAIGAASVVALLALGLVTGGGDMGHAFGADWALVDWPSVATMLLVVALIAAIALPLAWRLLPRAVRGVGTAFVAAAIVAPLGLVAPGFAYGEGSTVEVQQAFGYVPSGLHDLSTIFSAPFAGYNLPLPFFADAKAALWQQAIGYEIAGILGIIALAAVMVAFGRILRQVQGPTDAERGDGHARTLAERARGRGRGHSHDGAGWAEHTIAGITGSVERTVFTEEHARRPGWLQRVDPRAKLAMFLAVVLAASLSGSFAVLVGLYVVVVLAAVASRVPLDFFIRRVWLGIPLFAGVIAIPAIFLVPGPRLFEIAVGPVVVAPSIPGLTGAVIFVARVAVSVSLAVLLVMTTPWADLLKSLQAIRVPRLFVLVLAMAYRYIFLFLHLTNGMFEARKSRMVGRTTGGEHRRWITGSMGNLLNRSFKMSGDVYAAMIARGFTGTIRTFQDYRMRAADWAALGGSAAVALVALLLPRVLP